VARRRWIVHANQRHGNRMVEQQCGRVLWLRKFTAECEHQQLPIKFLCWWFDHGAFGQVLINANKHAHEKESRRKT